MKVTNNYKEKTVPFSSIRVGEVCIDNLSNDIILRIKSGCKTEDNAVWLETGEVFYLPLNEKVIKPNKVELIVK